MAQLDYLIQRRRQEGAEAGGAGIIAGQTGLTGMQTSVQSQYGFSTALGPIGANGLPSRLKYTGFMQSSNLSGSNLYTLVNADVKRTRGVAEYLLWRFKCRMPGNQDKELSIMTL